MAMIFTIDRIEGNSHIGVPVFSASAKKENKNFMVFSQPRKPKKNDDSDEEEEVARLKKQAMIASGVAINSQEASTGKLQIVRRIKDLEQQQHQIIEASNATSTTLTTKTSPRLGKSPQPGVKGSKSPFGAKPQQYNSMKSSPFKSGAAHQIGGSCQTQDSFAFAAISRDHYYEIHGEKRTVPKNGNYHPRFEIIEKRVIGPAYETRKALKKILNAREKIEKHRAEQFEKDAICDRIFRILDENRTTQNSTFWNRGSRSQHKSHSNTQSPALQTEHGLMPNSSGTLEDIHPPALQKSAATLHHDINQVTGSQTQLQTMTVTPGLIKDMARTGYSSNGNDHRFAFKHQPLSQKYTLVNHYPEKQIVKDEIPIVTDRTGPRILAIDFCNRQKRANFVSPNDPPNEHRFNPPATLLSFNTISKETSKGQHSVDIGRLSYRDQNLILKGGDTGRDLSINVAPNYDPNKEVVLPQPSKRVLDFNKVNNRTLYRSIYRKEHSPDYYDVKKIHQGFNRLSQIVQPKALLEIAKHQKRDMSFYYRYNNEALKNIERENKRQDFIKRLIEEEVTDE